MEKTQFSRATDQRAWAAPLLRWAGSKRKLVRLLTAYVPTSLNRYLEPFAGSACLFFALHPKAAVLGDINAALLETYEIVRDHPRRLARLVLKMPNNERNYYRVRRSRPEQMTPLERAARFVYLNRNCFNGVYRTNRQGNFNVPRGKKTGGLPTERDFVRSSIALRVADLRCGDFEKCLHDVGAGDFVYLDPPYASETRRPTGEYGYGCFAKPDHQRLIDCLAKIDSANATFLLSYSDSPTLLPMLRTNWQCRRVSVRRHVAGFADHRSRVTELLVTNYDHVVGETA